MRVSKNILLLTNSLTDAEIEHIIIAINNTTHNIQLNLVHVIPALPTCYFNIPSMVLLAEHYYEEAKQSLRYIGELLQVSEREQWLITGRVRPEVLRLADKLKSRFILASSTCIQDLQRGFLFKKASNTAIESIQYASTAWRD